MHSIEEFCSDVLILNKGETVIKVNLKEIKEQYNANRVSSVSYTHLFLASFYYKVLTFYK